MVTFRTGQAFAAEMDRQDELAPFRDRFIIDDPDLIYLDGNSLGRLPKETVALTQAVVEQQWGHCLIRSWNERWIDLQEHIGSKIARLLGAESDEIIIADSTSVNLFKLAMAAVYAQPDRHKIVTDDLNFPSDLYILQGAAKLAGRRLQIEVVASEDGIHGPVRQLAQAIDRQTALVALSHTVYKSSFTYDMAALTKAAQDAGAFILWDLSHSAGAVPVNLHAANAALAVGCTYKYLNGGPGAPAFLYVRRDWQPKLDNPITGWMGQQRMFDFALAYERHPGLRHFLTGTPPILSISAIEPGVDLLLEAGLNKLRQKSIRQTEYLIYLWEQWLKPLGFSLDSPRDPNLRGSHIALGHNDGWRINQALIHDMKIIPDFRKPVHIRLGVAPLYTSYMDIYTAIEGLRVVVTDRLYQKYEDIQVGTIT